MNNNKTVCYHIKSTWHAISRMYNNMGEDPEISTSIGYVLLNIDPKKGTPATKIAPSLGMETGSLTRVLKSLEEKGWIYKEADEEDGRKVWIKLTELGLEKREISKQAVKEFNSTIKDEITPEQMKTFLQVIKSINNIANNSQLA